MAGRIRTHLRSNVYGLIAIFIALSGSAYAAVTLEKNQVKSKHIGAGQVKNADIAENSVTSPKVADGSLLNQDFAAGQLPQGQQGPAGPQGERGPEGPQGPAGSPDTPQQVRDKLKQADGAGSGVDADVLDGQSSGSFLGASATATNADRLDGQDSSAFLGVNAKANDSNNLDGIDSSQFLRDAVYWTYTDPSTSGVKSATAYCNSGDTLIGGGFYNYTNEVAISFPYTDYPSGVRRDGWYVYTEWPTNSLSAYAMCVRG